MREKQSSQDGAVSEAEISLKYENGKQVVKGGVLGFFIGLAVIVPGVSGSAMAIIFKMYEKLLYAFGNLFRRFRKCVCFLLPVALGGVVGLILGFFGVKELLNLLPFATVALFAGLMTGAFPAVADELKGVPFKKYYPLLFLFGLLVPVAVTLLSTFLSEGERTLSGLGVRHYLLFLFLGFVVAITQLVPGLSATALLMAVGYFTPLVNSVSFSYWKENGQIFLVYLCLISGFVVGLVVVSKFLSRLLQKHRGGAFSVIAGLALGSIATMFFNSEVLSVYRNWAESGAWRGDLIGGILLFAVGVAAAYFFVRYERKKNRAAFVRRE